MKLLLFTDPKGKTSDWTGMWGQQGGAQHWMSIQMGRTCLRAPAGKEPSPKAPGCAQGSEEQHWGAQQHATAVPSLVWCFLVS